MTYAPSFASSLARTTVTIVFTLLCVGGGMYIASSEANAQTEEEQLNALTEQVNLIARIVDLFGMRGEVLAASVVKAPGSTLVLEATQARVTFLQKRVEQLTNQLSVAKRELSVAEEQLLSLTSNIRPECTLTTDKKEYTLGDTITFTWTTKNAQSVTFVSNTEIGKENLVPPRGEQRLSGKVTIPATILGNPSLTLQVVGKTSNVLCEARVDVVEKKKAEPRLAEYRGYFEGSDAPFIITKNISKGYALANCALNTRQNPSKKVWCTWNDEVIMGTKPTSSAGTQTAKVVISAFNVVPSEVTEGQPVQFAWVSNLTRGDVRDYGAFCSIEGMTQSNRTFQVYGPGSTVTGSTTFTPTESAAYTLVCSSGAKEGSPSASARTSVSIATDTPTGPVPEFIDATDTVVVHATTPSQNKGIFTIKFDVVAHDTDVYIKRSAAQTAADVGVLFDVNDASGRPVSMATTSAVLTSDATMGRVHYVVNEGETRTFTLTVHYDPAVSGAYSVAASALLWSESTIGAVKRLLLPASEFTTQKLSI